MKGKFFQGDTVVVLASGPSLVEQDIEATRHLRCIAVNNTWEKVRHCEVIFAGDHRWWCDNAEKIDIRARRVSLSNNSELMYNATRFNTKVAKNAGYNSGAVAIEYAVVNGAKRVILLGMDCSVKNGEHHHGPHTKMPNPNPQKCAIWKQQFAKVRFIYPDADIVNCSRYTELDMFPIMELNDCAHGSILDIRHQSGDICSSVG